jgi:hypothetical protein
MGLLQDTGGTLCPQNKNKLTAIMETIPVRRYIFSSPQSLNLWIDNEGRAEWRKQQFRPGYRTLLSIRQPRKGLLQISEPRE